MAGAVLWIPLIAVLIISALVFGAVLADGVYQCATGRPGFLPLERIFRKRVPATELDCVRQGASKILQVAAMACLEAPPFVIAVRSAAALTGLISSGPHAPPPLGLDVLMIVGLFGPPMVGLGLAIASYVVSTRINYVAISAARPTDLASA